MKNIIVSEKQLETLTNLVKNRVSEDTQGKDSMAKQQLFTIATLAYKMWESMEDNEQLEDWEESKIAQCEQSIIAVVKNFMYDEFVDGEDEMGTGGMDKLSFNDLIIGK
jgi:hypothetical protein